MRKGRADPRASETAPTLETQRPRRPQRLRDRTDPRASEAAPTLTTSDTAELASTRNRGDADCADTSESD